MRLEDEKDNQFPDEVLEWAKEHREELEEPRTATEIVEESFEEYRKAMVHIGGCFERISDSARKAIESVDNNWNVAMDLLQQKLAIERNIKPVTATLYVNPVDAPALLIIGLKEFKDFIVSPYVEQGYVYDYGNFCLTHIEELIKPFYYQDDIDIGVSLTDLLCNCIETQPCNYEIQQPRMNREQRRKAEREKRKKYKIQNGKKVDLDMNLKGVWGNKE